MNNQLVQNIFWTAEFRMPWIIHRSFSDIRKKSESQISSEAGSYTILPTDRMLNDIQALSDHEIENEINEWPWVWNLISMKIYKSNQNKSKNDPSARPQTYFFQQWSSSELIELSDWIDWSNRLIELIDSMIDWIDWLNWLIDWLNWLIELIELIDW